MFKNVASQKLAVYAYDTSANGAKTGDAANITCYISKDGAAAAQSNDVNPTELDNTNMQGVYIFDLTQAETNCDLFKAVPVSSTADIILDPIMIYTVPPNFTTMGIESDGDLTKVNSLDGHTVQTGDNYTRLGAPAGASVSADIASVKSDSGSILTDTADMQPKLGTPAGADMSTDIANVKVDTAAILTDTADMQPKLGTPAGADISTDIANVKAETALIYAQMQTINPKKNTALPNIPVPMVDTSGDPATGLTVSGYRSIDGGAFAAVGGSIAELSNGVYHFDALAADLNGDFIIFRFTATGAKDGFLTIRTSG
jgi:hypothetical protein